MVQSSFIKSAMWPKDYPELEGRVEIAVAGRSNVGKSSLINAITHRKRLARVSNTPGRTQLLNFFLINQKFVLCDLPGFGYAKVPLAMKRQWGEMMERYLTEREPLCALMVLMDSRRDPGDWERELITLGSLSGWGIIPIVTKIDKLSRNRRKPALNRIGRSIGLPAHQLIAWSAVSRDGYDQIWSTLNRFVDRSGSTQELNQESRLESESHLESDQKLNQDS